MQNAYETGLSECRETFIDYLVKKAKADGAFDNLPGAGKPIADLEEPYDELWWAKKLIEREDLKKVVGASRPNKDERSEQS